MKTKNCTNLEIKKKKLSEILYMICTLNNYIIILTYKILKNVLVYQHQISNTTKPGLERTDNQKDHLTVMQQT